MRCVGGEIDNNDWGGEGGALHDIGGVGSENKTKEGAGESNSASARHNNN